MVWIWTETITDHDSNSLYTVILHDLFQSVLVEQNTVHVVSIRN